MSQPVPGMTQQRGSPLSRQPSALLNAPNSPPDHVKPDSLTTVDVYSVGKLNDRTDRHHSREASAAEPRAGTTAPAPPVRFTSTTWRHGSRGELRSSFAAVHVWSAGKAVERPIKAAASAEQGWWDGVLSDCWLPIKWPADAETPTNYWLSNLSADNPITDLFRLAKVRRWIEHDYRELKHGLGLDHLEGRPWPGRHHHATRDRRTRLPHRTAPGPKSARAGPNRDRRFTRCVRWCAASPRRPPLLRADGKAASSPIRRPSWHLTTLRRPAGSR